MKQTVKDYRFIEQATYTSKVPLGDSGSPKNLIFHILSDNSDSVDVLDIGFGEGTLGKIVKESPATSHWHVDGIDGWEENCYNTSLFKNGYYRNVWHGMAQELPNELLSKYRIVCLLDVIEHLSVNTAKDLLRDLLTHMGDDSFLFVSTPLWFYPQDQVQDGDLEEHKIGIPASSMFALIPVLYSISEPLIGGFVYSKKSLNYVEFFQPTENKEFTYQMGRDIVRAINVNYKQGEYYRLDLH